MSVFTGSVHFGPGPFPVLASINVKKCYTTGFFTSGKHGGIVASETRAMPGKEKRNDPQTIHRFVQNRISGTFAVQL